MAANMSSRFHPLQQQHDLGQTVEEAVEPSPSSMATKSKTWQTTITHVPSWPGEARALKKHTWLTYVFGVGDIILLLLPIYFLRKCRCSIFLTWLTNV
jgi:hypothetical protein